MQTASPSPSTLNGIAEAHQAYVSLMQIATGPDNHCINEPGLGGLMLYVRELDDLGRGYTVAANIAGAATLAVSGGRSALRGALREGAVDFLVNSLDEALRILKNEIRKCQPVAVAVSHENSFIEDEMLVRGVRPDILPPSSDTAPESPALATFLSQGARRIAVKTEHAPRNLFVWSAPTEFAQNLAAFDAMLVEYLEPADHLNRRWLRLSPRYLGPAARRLRSLYCDGDTAAMLISRLGPPLNL